MLDKEVFLAQVQKLVTWLHKCPLPDVQTGRHVKAADYNEKFFKWLTVRFRTKHGRKENGSQFGKTQEQRDLFLNTTPQMWIKGLEEACACLHEVRQSGNTRLLLIEMTAHGAPHVPLPQVPYYDESGVFNLAFVCAKHDDDTTDHHVIYLTDVGQGKYGVIGSKCFWGGIDCGGQCIGGSYLDDDTPQYMFGGQFDRYGIPSTKDCGTFEDDMLSDYFALHDENERLLLTIHRIASVPAAVVAAQSYQQRDPVRFAQKKAQYRARLREYAMSL
jgi:hypothetical protein